MSDRVLIQPIVEGHGEEDAIRILLSRLWHETLAADSHLEVLRPWRMPRARMVKETHLARVIHSCALKLRQRSRGSERALILLLADADDDLPCELGPELTRLARKARGDVDSTCVIAKGMYETWFAAAAESLAGKGYLRIEGETPPDPEGRGLGKPWIKRHFVGSYKETVDQSKLTHAMDLAECRRLSPSFDKLCRELAKLIS